MSTTAVVTTAPQWPTNPPAAAPQAVMYPMPTLQQLQEISGRLEWFERNAGALERQAAAAEGVSKAIEEALPALSAPVQAARPTDEQIVYSLMVGLAPVMPGATPLAIVQRARDLTRTFRIFFPANTGA